APFTPESILREFRATADKRLTDTELIALLKTICFKRPNHSAVLAEITYILERKDPMYALMVFSERMSDDNTWASSSSSRQCLEMPPPATATAASTATATASSLGHKTSHMQAVLEHIGGSTNSLAEEQLHVARSRKSLDLSTSTPVTSRKTDLSPTHSTGAAIGGASMFGRRPTPSASDQIAPRGDLSVVSARSIYPAATANPIPFPLGRSRSASGISIGVPSIHLNSNRSGRVNISDGFPDGYRTHLLWDFPKVDEGLKPLAKHEVAGLPLDSQQRVLLMDLIYCLSGVRGSYTSPLPPDDSAASGIARYETRFSVNQQLDKSLTEILHEILPLASHFMGIQKVIAAMDGRGQVNNSLNAALQGLSHDYYMLLMQAEQELDKGELTVPKLLYYLQPTIWVMEEIWNTVAELQLVVIPLLHSTRQPSMRLFLSLHLQHGHQGAAVLSYLCGRIKRMEGDKAAQNLIIKLTSQAAEPYMKILQQWIQKGVIVDSTQEFLVEDNEVIHRGELPEHYSDDYWERRYTIRKDCIPTFLEKHADKILRTGKYLNVIRQCGKRVLPTQQMDLQFDPTNEKHVYVINDAYYFAARMLLDVLLTENDLMGHLQSVKRYLLLNQGDFTMQFMDACEDELSKNVDLVLPMTLENLLGLTLRLSSARSDPYKDDLHCELLTYDLVTQMSKIMDQKEEYWQTTDRLDLIGLECFAFSYDVKWPVSLVLNHIAITKYQMLFRQLFYCKHVERQLCKIWKENSIAKKFSPAAAELYRSAFTLRQRMMNAIQNLEYYMMIEIIDPNWHIFIEKMKSVENVDMVLKLHHDFLDLCLKNCMLTETSHLNRAIFKLCKICLKFCEFIQRSQRFFLDAELKSMVCDSSGESTDVSESEQETSERPQVETSLDPTETFSERVNSFDLEFTGMLISFLKQINDLAKDNTADRFMNLVHRINFNGFYSEQMEKLCATNAMG
ncbi:hypothetical protein KR222_004543, partial [Zaprionus bogoriensis]